MSKLPFKIKKGDTTLEKIMAHHIDPARFPLSPKLEEIRKRWAEVLTLSFNYYSPQQIVNKLQEDHGVSLAQAYLDVKNAQTLYGNVMESDKKGKQAILYEYAHKYYQRSIQAKDLKAQAKALELMAKFGGLDDVDMADFNPEKLENVEIKFSIPKAYLELLKKDKNTGVADFNASGPVVDIPHEEVDNEAD
ncbi:hypothetical protein FHS04_001240 [Mesoflavibacter sabulilitoris]|uniref:Uncharacterized protein n=1 Tax=Mesoflavibacter zeaxanthinifaciens subsp. sabulilitoris TaxID=1520893 RepID=A0A2T1NAI3_9FLAO|nr:hypothetical protein [Mesoflavibacter zeaxanthinifaciens]MBB3123737.1 hypothetical protein [Mesoflavibacter zeaxanthinifaciens subsp. sabulilitoris]PSG89142.1 hypothetical protein C7H61_09295 [Mesoflavibacter zeaxanthinifaciens subsp. sabulilitoris]